MHETSADIFSLKEEKGKNEEKGKEYGKEEEEEAVKGKLEVD